MTDLSLRPHTLLENYDLVRGLLSSFGPDHLSDVRQKAFERFQTVGVPTTRDEEFKYIPLRRLTEAEFQPAYGATIERETLERLPLGKVDAFTLVFINGQYAPELGTIHALPEGVFIGSLQDAYEQFPSIVEAHLGRVATLEGKLGTTNDNRFVDLNTAYLGEGAFLYVPKETSLTHPVQIVYLSQADHGAFVSHPRTLVVLEEAADLKLVESYIGTQGEYFTNAVTEIVLGVNAMMEHTKFQNEAAAAIHIGNIGIQQATGSIYTSNLVNFGGQTVRNDINTALDGEHTETWLNAASVGIGSQLIDNHTRLDHQKPNCNSFQVYKQILRDESTGVFNGKIFVYEDAQKTDAKQTNQAILLSPTATFNTKPQLEIFADDVKCTHGATIGQLREDAMFYLQARGIPKAEATSLLVYAFAAEVLEKITIPDVREALEQALFDKLGR